MNLLDYAILAIFAAFLLSGVYKGFLSTLLSIGCYIVSVSYTHLDVYKRQELLFKLILDSLLGFNTMTII